ncbi:MAG: ATP synthase F1 subunit epsilon [Coriobacteriia bacterium]|nr:ATP synthase F1 subunit epsilon [Coriobacteriia bacterium]
MSVIRCDVVAKDKVLYSGELFNVMVPGTEGELGIMENHEPFVSALHDGVIWARTKEDGGQVLAAAIMGGYVQVLKDRVIVICDKTRAIDRINLERVKADIPVLEERIANLREDSLISRSLLSRKLRWCKVQLAAKEKEQEYYGR